MKKSEMYNLVMDKVCEICEVRRDTVINGRKMQAVVDARILIVQYLKRIGLSSDDIALMVLRELAADPSLCPPLSELKKKAKAVDKMFNFYSSRCLESYSFCLMSGKHLDCTELLNCLCRDLECERHAKESSPCTSNIRLRMEYVSEYA